MTDDDNRPDALRSAGTGARGPALNYRVWWADLFAVAALVLGGYVVADQAELLERFERWSAANEGYQADKWVVGLVLSVFGLLWFSWRRYRQARADAFRLVATENELAAANERYRSLVDYHPSAVFSLDVSGRFLTANDAAATMTGRDLTQLNEMTGFWEVLSEDTVASVGAAFLRVLERRAEYVEATIVRRDGTRSEVAITGLPIVVDERVVGVYGIVDDVTEHNRMQRELSSARRSAEHANEAKSLFLANMSHEIRTPLTSIMAITELLAESEADPEQRRFLDMMERNGQRLLRLVDDILDFSRVEAGQARLEPTVIDLRALVLECVAALRPEAEAKGLLLHAAVAEVLPTALVGDGDRIRQVLGNLVDNAVKFTETGGVAVTVEVLDSSGAAPTTSVAFSVEDTGIGMSGEQLAGLFQSFSQADPSITRRYGGTGLGLAISRQLVELMDGTIGVSSELGAGSVFTVVLPLTDPVLAAAPA